jgi:hypothetical protein
MTLNSIRKILYEKMKIFNSFLIIVESEYPKKIAFFVPKKFEDTNNN